ncbi:Neuron navigator 2-like [Homarus americanus]|uniref:Neuron navigator 2-like n=1 Tax=Homarus americanus TaxID=6706 RepID=A0A8J5JLW9_HOMAM|nr:Neuron navigator 2-like [Homarus americanus]
MTELGYATLPRGPRLPIIHNGFHNHNGHLPNGHLPNSTTTPTSQGLPQVPTLAVNGGLINGCVRNNGSPGGRAVHDGFATIRSGGGKRGRARSTPSVTSETRTTACHHGCCNTGGRAWAMEPLWEERGIAETPGAVPITRRDRSQLPWWEVATRRSKYRSCPAFSQASMVSALEQTMSSVTDKLERLASSPDLKETEAAELRKTAAVLRQQSSAVCQSVNSGYFGMERQLSCDSVSSVTSTVSGASLSSYASLGSRSLSATHTPHYNPHNLSHTQSDSLNPPNQAKLKKRSWLRSSFRRAFGRHGRKRSKQTGEGNPDEIPQELPLHHTVNAAVRHLPPPPPSSQSVLVQQQQRNQILGTLQRKQSLLKQQKQQQEATEKERVLTDCRLEVLSAQHQLQAQADTIARLQAEVTGLREENGRLVSLVRGQCGAAADSLLTPLTNTFTSLTLSHASVNGGNTSPREEGRRVKVVVVNQPDLTSIHNAAAVALDPNNSTHIGNINVESKTTWEELDTLMSNSLKDYWNRVDPVSALGLDPDSVLCYRVEDVVRSSDLPRPELLPYGYCVGDVDALHVWLKDGETIGSVSAASFTSVTPATSLKRLASLLVEHRRLVLAGPPAAGKTSLARTLAQFFVVNSGRELSEDAIKIFKVNGTNTLELCQLLSSMWPRGLTSGRSASSLSSASTCNSVSASSITTDNIQNLPAVIILDDLHTAGGVVETLQRCLPVTVHTGPAIIATCCPTAALSTHGLHLAPNRNQVVAAEVAANTRLPDAHHLAEWLTRLWLHLNTVLSGHCGSHEVGIGPGLLMDCPLGQEETQAWFTEVWNTRLVPCIKTTVRASASTNSGMLDTWTDPLDWVLATYPWPNNAACGSDQLTRIPASDMSQQDTTGVPSSRTMSPRRHYVPLSARQQNQKFESVYAVPQLLPQVPVIIGGGTQGTGQTVSISQRNNKTCNSNQIMSSHINDILNKTEDIQTIYSNIGSESYVMATVRRGSDSSACMNQVRSLASLISNGGSGGEITVTPGPDNNRKFSTCTVGRTNSNNINQTGFIKPQNKLASPRENECNAKNMNEDEGLLSSEDESMESDNIMMEQVHNEKTFRVQNQNDCISTEADTSPVEYISQVSNDKDKVAMETEPLLNRKPQSLDVLAKNAINAIGFGPECVRIIRAVGPKQDLKGMAQELTTTFKPV